jgi:hypothetical protein
MKLAKVGRISLMVTRRGDMSYLQAAVSNASQQVARVSELPAKQNKTRWRCASTSWRESKIQAGASEEAAHDVNRGKTVVSVLEVLCHAVLVAAQLLTHDVGIRHRHNLDVVLFDADRAAAVPYVGVQGVELACTV